MIRLLDQNYLLYMKTIGWKHRWVPLLVTVQRWILNVFCAYSHCLGHTVSVTCRSPFSLIWIYPDSLLLSFTSFHSPLSLFFPIIIINYFDSFLSPSFSLLVFTFCTFLFLILFHFMSFYFVLFPFISSSYHVSHLNSIQTLQ